MTIDSTVVSLRQPDAVDDPLTAVLRDGARRLLAQAVEAEAEAFLASMRDARLPDGRDRLVRHGHGPERMMQTGIGPVAVRRGQDRRRGGGGEGRGGGVPPPPRARPGRGGPHPDGPPPAPRLSRGPGRGGPR